jgi:hypothetical protein
MPDEVLPEAPEAGRAPGRRGGTVRYALPILKFGVRRLMREKSPFQMTLSLTNRCNFRCTYCEIPLQHRDEMSTAEWLAAIDELQAGGMCRASIIGGEPLLRKDAGDIVRHLKRRGVHASMNTNGWLVAERIDQIAGLDLVCVTLDGPAEVHDRAIRRCPRAGAIGLAAAEASTPHDGHAGRDRPVGACQSPRAVSAYFQLERGSGRAQPVRRLSRARPPTRSPSRDLQPWAAGRQFLPGARAPSRERYL